MIHVEKFTFNPFQENTYILYDQSKECVIIDPGCFDKNEEQLVSDFVALNELKVVKLFNTHAHIDHILGNAFVKARYGVDLYGYSSEFPMLDLANRSAKMYQIPYTESPPIDVTKKEGDKFSFGNSTLEIIYVPGHAPDHLVLFHPQQKLLIGGDVLFNGSIGRTDLPGGEHDLLIKNIQEKIFTLPDETIVYSGHGPETKVGIERRTNPFF